MQGIGNFSKRDTTVLKGFAILCIVFHNYFRWLSPSPGENEFGFSANRIVDFFYMLGDNPGEWLNILLSYLGHFGVQIFIFLSGFGLAVSMLNHPRTWESFVLTRLKKLYPLLLTGVLVMYLGRMLIEAGIPGPYTATEVGYKLLFIHTLIPDSALTLIGPWWFFGLIFQLYLFFPLIFKWTQRWGWKAFVGICVCCYGMFFLFRYVLDLYKGSVLMMNAPGHLPEFCLGVLLALQKDKKIWWGWLVLAIAVFCLGNVYELFYPFTFLSVTVISVFVIYGVKRIPVKKQWLSRPLAYFGGFSMTLFAVHVIFRTPILKIAESMNGPWGHFLPALIFLLIVWGVALAAKVFYDFLCRQLDRIKIRENRITHFVGVACEIATGLFFAYVLGFFVAQNLHENTQPMTDLQVTESGIIEEGTEYFTFVRGVADGNWLSFDYQCSFDFSSLDTLAPLPILIMDIPGCLWKEVTIPESYKTSKPQHFETEIHYNRQFNKKLKGKAIKMYFKNSCKDGPFKIENIQVTLTR